MSYVYELIVYYKETEDKTTKLKRFIGNDINQLKERFEVWFIKQGYDREEIEIYIGHIQHTGYVTK